MALTCYSSGTSPHVLRQGKDLDSTLLPAQGQIAQRLDGAHLAWERWQPRESCQPGARGIVCWESVQDFGCKMISPHGTRGSEGSQVTKAHPALTMVMVGHTKELSGGGEEH